MMHLSAGANKRSTRSPTLIAALVLGLALAVSPAAPANSASLTINDSIVLYKPTSTTTGTARFGTLANGVLTLKGSLSTGKWTHAAVSIDTLLFYNSATGKGVTGIFRDGVFTRKGTFQIATSFNRVAASEDSVLFYNRTTGVGSVGILRGGLLSRVDPGYRFATGWDLISSSFDTITFWRNAKPGVSAFLVTGTLRDGSFSQVFASEAVPEGYTSITNTTDSYLWYSRTNHFGRWGKALNGIFHPGDSSGTFGAWTHVAGTGDSVLFYNTTSGLAARAILIEGVYRYAGATQLTAGWKVIVGGR